MEVEEVVEVWGFLGSLFSLCELKSVSNPPPKKKTAQTQSTEVEQEQKRKEKKKKTVDGPGCHPSTSAALFFFSSSSVPRALFACGK